MDTNEGDELMLAVLAELRELRACMGRIGDTMMLVNQTCVRIGESMERLDARVTLLHGAAE